MSGFKTIEKAALFGEDSPAIYHLVLPSGRAVFSALHLTRRQEAGYGVELLLLLHRFYSYHTSPALPPLFFALGIVIASSTQQFLSFFDYISMFLPREKLETMGARALTDEELLSVMLGAGTKGNPVHSIASEVLPLLELSGVDVNVSTLQEVHGVGRSKALLLAAAMEFSRRRIRPEGVKIKAARDVLPLLHHLVDRPQEHVVTISLSGAHEVIRIRTVSIGLLTSCPVHPREVFVGPISDHAYSIILAHNHPSGDPSPSADDRQVTKQLGEAAKTLGMRMLDHIIFARRGYYSFQEHGEM